MHSLRVLHVKKNSENAFGNFPGYPGALFVNTCLRKLWIYSDEGFSGLFRG